MPIAEGFEDALAQQANDIIRRANALNNKTSNPGKNAARTQDTLKFKFSAVAKSSSNEADAKSSSNEAEAKSSSILQLKQGHHQE